MRPGVLWLLLSSALALATLLAHPVDAALLDWQPQRAWPEIWRWWSSALVHLTPQHLAANLLATVLVATYGWSSRVPSAVAWAWLASWPVTHLALWARPELLHYGGLSGVLHGGVAATSVWLALRGTGSQRVIGGLMLVGQGAKLLLEAPWGAAVHPPGQFGVAVAPLAHASGSLAGALLTVIVLQPWRRPSD